MEYTDSEKLLRECDAGTKMAVTSIDEVLDKTRDMKLAELLNKSRSHHEKLEKEIHARLNEQGIEEKDPSVMAKGMSWMKTNMKVGMDDEPDAVIADVMTDGCNMGIKSLYKYMNQYQHADQDSRKFAEKLLSIEEELRRDLKDYLS